MFIDGAFDVSFFDSLSLPFANVTTHHPRFVCTAAPVISCPSFLLVSPPRHAFSCRVWFPTFHLSYLVYTSYLDFDLFHVLPSFLCSFPLPSFFFLSPKETWRVPQRWPRDRRGFHQGVHNTGRLGGYMSEAPSIGNIRVRMIS